MRCATRSSSCESVEVSVDTGTGHIRVDRVTSTHDVGKAINPRLVQGQIEGAVVQAHGYVMSENLRVEDGRTHGCVRDPDGNTIELYGPR